jgi:hypothetical protein
MACRSISLLREVKRMMKTVRDYQVKMGLEPADGYGGLKVLARLRQGS